MTQPKHAWMVRAGDDNELADLVEEKKLSPSDGPIREIFLG